MGTLSHPSREVCLFRFRKGSLCLLFSLKYSTHRPFEGPSCESFRVATFNWSLWFYSASLERFTFFGEFQKFVAYKRAHQFTKDDASDELVIFKK